MSNKGMAGSPASNSSMSYNLGNLARLESELTTLKENVDAYFLLANGFFVVFMQCGFAFLECGAVRSKNATNILMKNLLDTFVAAFAYWALGFGLAYGEPVSDCNGFIGHSYFFSYGMPDEKFSFWFAQFVFSATASTIVSGALAERCEFVAYLFYSLFIPGIIYPIASHWVWSECGWLKRGFVFKGSVISFVDYAGSSTVHLLGGVSAFVGAALLGPRLHRFDQSGANELPGHSVPLLALGGFILIFGFFPFAIGSQRHISRIGDGAVIGRVTINMALCSSSAALFGLLRNRIVYFSNGQWSLTKTINCLLTGLVSICAGANVLYPWSACIMGIIASLIHDLISALLVRLRIDDPINAVAVHAGGGLWGIIAVALFSPKQGIILNWSSESIMFLVWQLVGAAAIVAWTLLLSLNMFAFLHKLNFLRVSEDVEIKGLDIPKHGEPAYPISAYGIMSSHARDSAPKLNISSHFLPWLKSANNKEAGPEMAAKRRPKPTDLVIKNRSSVDAVKPTAQGTAVSHIFIE